MRLLPGRAIFIICVLLLFLHPRKALGSDTNQFITIVNPVRISSYTKSPVESLRAQYKIIKDNDFPATWLLTYDVLINEELVYVVKNMNEKQELGIFLEITPGLAEAASIEYNDTGFWYHATSVFLSGYSQKDRIKLIDTVFDRYFETFGYYPTSVGSWWSDSFSLGYMRDKYNITSNLGCADQFSMDRYQIWGQYWSTPYYPSKYHAGIPASDEDFKIDLVTIQWAPRDPLNGYYNSLYSTQDYLIPEENLNTGYFEKLLKLYAQKGFGDFGQVTMGLEADLAPEAYTGEYKKQIETVNKLSNSGDFKVLSMSAFSDWYRNKYSKLSPERIIESSDMLGTPKKVFWYQSPWYRIGILKDFENNKTTIFDFRSYHKDMVEPYLTSPNRQFDLRVYIPSYFDKVNYKKDVWELDVGSFEEFKRGENGFELLFDDDSKIVLSAKSITIESNNKTPLILNESKALTISQSKVGKKTKSVISVNGNWLVDEEGLKVRDLTIDATGKLSKKRISAISLLLVFLYTVALVILKCTNSFKTKKLFLIVIIFVLPIFVGFKWYYKNSMDYHISQGEVDALFRLSVLPKGDVLVYDNFCLGCGWDTPQMPAAFANKRKYIKEHGNHPIVYNSSVFEAEDQTQAKEEFDKLNVKYIYLVKYGNIIEKIPFSPGDLGIEKLYDNANAEIWRVKE